MTRSMSGGNQQKAIIAREVELDSDLLIFVQPTRGLDVGAIANIHQQILEQRDKGKAVLLVSLELDEVLALGGYDLCRIPRSNLKDRQRQKPF